MKKHVNIPIFIPHMGCPNQCVFCNQRTISGVNKFEITRVKDEIEEALKTISKDTEAEIAFFGGSFTGIDRSLMISLLELGYNYVLQGKVSSIRCSTRPDYITPEILDILKMYGVKTIELGLQSYNDNVLSLCKRGHTAEDEKNATAMIVEHGFDLVGQMMIGLPGSTLEMEIATAEFIIASGACGARIYPTVVFNETELFEMASKGYYDPITVSDAVVRSAKVLRLFIENNVKIIRIGLCASDNLYEKDKYYAGPNHPALGEMVEGELYFDIIRDMIARHSFLPTDIPVIMIAKGAMSKAIGHKRANKERLIKQFGFADIKFRENENLSEYEVKLEEGKRQCI